MESGDGAGTISDTAEPLSMNSRHADNAILAVQREAPPSEIDFSIHIMEDGTQLSTQDRVCKGKGNRQS